MYSHLMVCINANNLDILSTVQNIIELTTECIICLQEASFTRWIGTEKAQFRGICGQSIVEMKNSQPCVVDVISSSDYKTTKTIKLNNNFIKSVILVLLWLHLQPKVPVCEFHETRCYMPAKWSDHVFCLSCRRLSHCVSLSSLEQRCNFSPEADSSKNRLRSLYLEHYLSTVRTELLMLRLAVSSVTGEKILHVHMLNKRNGDGSIELALFLFSPFFLHSHLVLCCLDRPFVSLSLSSNHANSYFTWSLFFSLRAVTLQWTDHFQQEMDVCGVYMHLTATLISAGAFTVTGEVHSFTKRQHETRKHDGFVVFLFFFQSMRDTVTSSLRLIFQRDNKFVFDSTVTLSPFSLTSPSSARESEVYPGREWLYFTREKNTQWRRSERKRERQREVKGKRIKSLGNRQL